MKTMSNSRAKNTVKIMVFGTFDGLHPGHLNFFKQARNLSKKNDSFLVISIARDKNVFRIKGQYPLMDEKKRLYMIKKSRVANRTVLAGLRSHIPHIKKENPDIIALGYDQRAYVKGLKKGLANEGIFVKIKRLRPYKQKIYKNRLLRNKR